MREQIERLTREELNQYTKNPSLEGYELIPKVVSFIIIDCKMRTTPMKEIYLYLNKELNVTSTQAERRMRVIKDEAKNWCKIDERMTLSGFLYMLVYKVKEKLEEKNEKEILGGEEMKENQEKKNEVKHYIVRGDRSGVFFGEIEERNGTEVTLRNCRRLWYWDGACSISELAEKGTKKPNNCKFTVIVDRLQVLDAIEIDECTEKATKSILEVQAWQY